MPEGDWEDGYEAPVVPAWADVVRYGELMLKAAATTIEPGSATRVTVKSPKIEYLGKEAVLRIRNPTVTTAETMREFMQPNEVDGVQAVFLVKGMVPGESTLSVEVIDGSEGPE